MPRKSRNPYRYGVAWSNGKCHATRKTRYKTQRAAMDSLARIIGRTMGGNWDWSKQPTRVYLCEFCNGWHLTAKFGNGIIAKQR